MAAASRSSSSSFLRHFAALPDPRVARTRRHTLLDILGIALVSVLCGAEGFTDMAAFGRAKAGWLKERLGLSLPGGIPSHDTFGRVFSRLDPEALGACLMSWTAQLHQKTAGEVVALDGKTLRQSFDSATGSAALHLVRAWASGSGHSGGLALGQKKVAGHSNEIEAIPALLRLLDVEGCTVTLDAMGCQKKIAKQIVSQRADYVLALKANQETLHGQVADFFAWAEKGGFAEVEYGRCRTVDYGHGRREVRECYTLDAALDFPQALKNWAGLRTIALVRATRQERGRNESVQRRFFLSSLPPDKPRTLLRGVRRHWHIENRLHWVLDVAFGEDASRVRKDHAPHNLALVRQIALDLLRQETSDKTGVKARRKRAGWDQDYLLRVLVGPGRQVQG